LQSAYSKLEKYNKYLNDSKKELAIANESLNHEKEKLVQMTEQQTKINGQLVSDFLKKKS